MLEEKQAVYFKTHKSSWQEEMWEEFYEVINEIWKIRLFF